MSNTKYALRANIFGYNDEHYNIYDDSDDGRVCGIYESREAAMDAWKKLEHKSVKNRPLGDVLFYRLAELQSISEEEVLALDSFLFERCGQHIFDEDGEWMGEECEMSVAQMNVEDVFEFLTKAKLHCYKLVEYQPTDETFYVWWFSEKESYIFSLDTVERRGVCRASSVEELYDEYSYFFRYYFDGPREGKYCFAGTLEELSHCPEILQTLIADNRYIQYDETEQVLSLRDEDAFKLVYPLLINPPLEVREVTLEQIIEIEKDLPENLY